MNDLALQNQLADIFRSSAWLLPQWVLLGQLLSLLLLDFLVPAHRLRSWLPWLTGAGLLLSGYMLVIVGDVLPSHTRLDLYQDLLHVSHFNLYFQGLALVAALMTTTAVNQHPILRDQTEFWMLMTTVTLGMHLMVMSNHALTLLLSLELVSISSYLLTAYPRDNRLAAEAGLKYILYGGFASGLMIYGFSLLFGLTGALNFMDPQFGIQLSKQPAEAVIVALMFILAGLSFKVAAFPFHFWVPDIYQGAATPVSAFFAVGPKAAGFGVLLNLHPQIPDSLQPYWTPLLLVLAIASMLIGNLAALGQRDYKRLLAYSSIGHTGYMLMALPLPGGHEAVMLYLSLYIFFQFGAFLTADLLEKYSGTQIFAQWPNIRSGGLLAALVILLSALTGLPPTAGFVGKLNLFIPVWDHYVGTQQSLALIALIIALLSTVLSLYYYLRVPAQLLFRSRFPEGVPTQSSTEVQTQSTDSRSWLLAGCCIVSLLLGIWGFDQFINIFRHL